MIKSYLLHIYNCRTTFDLAVSKISKISTQLILAELSKNMSRLKEISALDAVITMLQDALCRIADVVKKIREVTEKKETDYGVYVGRCLRRNNKMVKIA